MPPDTNPFSAPERFSKKIVMIAVIVVVLIVVAVMFFYTQQKAEAPTDSAQPSSVLPAVPSTDSVAAPESLGGTLYNKATNPLPDALPTPTTVTNPIDGAYKNPF